jgi:cytidylate kinase
MPVEHLVITLDGPAGAGKSTVAKLLAKRLGIAYLDTGAMYRALTLKALRLKMDLSDEEALTTLARRTQIGFQDMPDGSLHIILDGEDVSAAIRTLDLGGDQQYFLCGPYARRQDIDGGLAKSHRPKPLYCDRRTRPGHGGFYGCQV